jgi:hypothetical protein
MEAIHITPTSMNEEVINMNHLNVDIEAEVMCITSSFIEVGVMCITSM